VGSGHSRQGEGISHKGSGIGKVRRCVIGMHGSSGGSLALRSAMSGRGEAAKRWLQIHHLLSAGEQLFEALPNAQVKAGIDSDMRVGPQEVPSRD